MGTQEWMKRLMARAGVTPNGPGDCDPQIHNPDFYRRVAWSGSLGLGNSYMDGWWDVKRLDQFICRLLLARIDRSMGWSWPVAAGFVWAKMRNLQSVQRAHQVAKHHYDLGNDLYQAMLGPTMAYSCGYWPQAQTLDHAQIAKYDLVCRKLDLKPGMRLLDIGCGWGGLARHAAEKYGVSVVGLTVSAEQAKYAREACCGLPVSIELTDYRQYVASPKFDRISSVGMFEHVGSKNYRVFMQMVRRTMVTDGLVLLHTIGHWRSASSTDPWIRKHIFPNSQLPSLGQISRASEGLFVTEDVHNFGADYDRTLMAWQRNFEAAYENLCSKYDARFRRMWNYYLQSCGGMFRARRIQLYQLVLSPRGVPGGYQTVR